MNYLWKRFNLIILIFFNYYFFIRNILQTHFFWLGIGRSNRICYFIFNNNYPFNFRKKSNSFHAILTLIFLIQTIIIVLKATIWRGSEYPWNGNVFL